MFNLSPIVGRLTILFESPCVKRGTSWHVECLCECGNKKYICIYSLKNRDTISCGCYNREVVTKTIKNYRKINPTPNKKSYGEMAFNKYFNEYKYSAKIKNREFNLTKDQFKQITQQNCYYCNELPIQEIKNNQITNGNYLHNGIDRKDNNKGYTLDNSVPCCADCNYLKSDLNYSKFIQQVHRISDNLKWENLNKKIIQN